MRCCLSRWSASRSCHQRLRFLVLLPGEQGGPGPAAAGEGGIAAAKRIAGSSRRSRARSAGPRSALVRRHARSAPLGVRLLRQVPAITELSQLDATGQEQLRVSRLAMDVVGSEHDFSKDPKFTEAVAHKVYYGPVYFRRESEPYMTLALAGDGRDAGVTVAEVNLKLIWDVVSAIKVGAGRPGLRHRRAGRLIAHPDISLVLRNTDLSRLAQVAAARATRQRGRRGRSGSPTTSPARGADRARADPAAGLADVRRAADRGGLCAALRHASSTRRATAARVCSLPRSPASSSRAGWWCRSRRCGGRRADRRGRSDHRIWSKPATSSRRWPISSTTWRGDWRNPTPTLEKKVERRTPN